MRWILIQVIWMTIVGLLILLIRKTVGKKLYPWVLTLLWTFFFLSALLPLTVIKDIQLFSQTEPERYVYERGEGERTILAETKDVGDLVARHEYNSEIIQFIRWFWLFGVTVSLFYKCGTWLLLHRKLKAVNVVFETDGEKAEGIPRGLSELVQEYQVKTKLLVTEDFGPAVYGLRPKIYIPQAVCGNELELKSILLHELVHVKRKHAFIVLLADILNALYWYVPYVKRLFLPALREDMEYHCDYDVVHKYGVKAKEYATHYVNTIETKHLAANELAFRKEALKERVDYILKRKGNRKVSILISSSILALLFSGLVGIYVYYQSPNHNGHSRAEIEDAIEVILEYAAAYERGDGETIQKLLVDKYTEESLEYNLKYHRIKVYSLAYDEMLNSYTKNYYRTEMYGTGYANFICIDGIATLKNRWDVHEKIPCYWTLYRENPNSRWKIAEVGK